MLYLGDMPYFLNFEPKFLDLKTYMSFKSMIKILHPPLLTANIGHKEIFIFLKGICLEKKIFVYFKV